MTQNNTIVTWLNFALQQMAAESYLHGVALSNEAEILNRLKRGSNNIPTASPDDPTLPGKTRMTPALADRFLATNDIIDHHANDASGFSATLMRDTTTGEYTLSFRSTEPRPGSTSCDRLKLKPADPLATEEGRFAHSIKIPNPVPADSGYKPGMTSQEYFDHLCKTEAGEFIFKKVENVEGIIQLRKRDKPTDYELEHLYAMEDPYGHSVGVGNHPEEHFVQPAIGKYQFLEVSILNTSATQKEKKYKRFYRDASAHPGMTFPTSVNGQFVQVPYLIAEVEVSSLKARYGYTWRGITRPHDREHGIAGGEVIVLDLEKGEVLAVRRSYARTGRMKNLTRVCWLTAQKCSETSFNSDAQFINQVLLPAIEK